MGRIIGLVRRIIPFILLRLPYKFFQGQYPAYGCRCCLYGVLYLLTHNCVTVRNISCARLPFFPSVALFGVRRCSGPSVVLLVIPRRTSDGPAFTVCPNLHRLSHPSPRVPIFTVSSIPHSACFAIHIPISCEVSAQRSPSRG